MTSERRTAYRIFVGTGFALILLGVVEIALGLAAHPAMTVRWVDVGGIGLLVCGVSIVLGTHWFHA